MYMKARHERIVDLSAPFDYAVLKEYTAQLAERFPFLSVRRIGSSYLSRDLDLLTFGRGARKSLFVGTHHGMERITSLILIRFVQALCETYSSGEKLAGYDSGYIYDTRTFMFVPMLNPDGAELAANGISSAEVIRERLIMLNEGSEDFSHWQANARGVDLNHNYDANFRLCKLAEREAGISYPCSTRFGGDYPESEPETAALCSFIRAEEDLALLYALHTQGEVIYWDYGEYTPPQSEAIARTLSRASGYELDRPDGTASHGGCKDWFITEFGRPGFTLECGLGVNPLPLSQAYGIYSRLEEALLLGGLA